MTGGSDAERKGHKRKLSDALQPIAPALQPALSPSSVTAQVCTLKLTKFRAKLTSYADSTTFEKSGSILLTL